MNVIVIFTDTLRRDHCGPYTGSKALNEAWSKEAPPWKVPTPNMNRLAQRGTVFTNCFCGSTPCMPARRDVYTGRYEFLERGWGPLEEDDFDLPRQVSGPPNRSVRWTVENGYRISYLITDHFHLWEQGSGNYHMGYSGFQFVRGCEADPLFTDPVEFDCPEGDRLGKNERHWRNVHFLRQQPEDDFCAEVFRKAADWLKRNRDHDNFYLHIDIFNPHEPWDPPEEILKMFDPKGYSVKGVNAAPPYAKWEGKLTEEQFNSYRARYSGKVVFLDQWLGHMFDAMDELDLWKDTLVILTTDHGTYNGDHGRIGKLQTHEHDACGHIPFIVAHPEFGHSETRDQLVQLVDIYPTVLAAVGRPLPEMPEDRPLHGVNLLPVLENANSATRDYAVMGQFGQSVSITDGKWILHQAPVEGNQPLNWYGHCLAKFIGAELGAYDSSQGCRPAVPGHANRYWFATPTWLSNKEDDMNELVNLAEQEPEKLQEMQRVLRQQILDLKAPAEQIERLGLEDLAKS